MRHANVEPLDISYIEMHGTGTQAGDATEMNSVLSVFVPEYKRTQLQPQRPLYIGSAKANIGHAESSSGVSSLIKVLMMMKHSEIPRHCGIKTRINHNYPLDLTQRGVNIAMETTPWRRPDSGTGKRAAFLNNFSAAGGNTAMLVEDAPPRRLITEKDSRPFHIITVTAKTPKSLVANINSLASYMEKMGSSISLAALSYTTTARRMHHNYRAVVSGPDAGSIISSLKSRAAETQDELADLKPIPAVMKKKARVVFMFSGQGTLYAELGRSLFVTNAAFRNSILKLNRLAQIQGFPAFLGLIDGSVTAEDLPRVGAIASQLALACVQIALFELWKSWGVTPAAVVGHSLGEYATLYAAGVLSIADVIYLVGTRAALLETRCTPGSHAMLAVKASLEVVNKLIHQTSQGTGCELACANQPSGHVISRPGDKISEVARAAAALGIETVRLNVSFAFHSAQVEPILTEFKQAASQGVAYHPPTVPVLSPLLGKLVPAGEHNTFNATYLTAACRGKVDVMGALGAAAAAPAEDGGLGFGAAERTIWLDIGAHPACAGMVKGTLGSQSKVIATLRQNVEAYKTLAASLEVMYHAGVEINWNEYHRHFPASHEVLDVPLYRWDLKNYWIQYKNNFCLTKGDDLIQQLAAKAPAVPSVVPKYMSPSGQKIIEESHGADQSSLLVESDIFDDRLLPVLRGHLVNEAALCPSSAWADLALTLANYMVLESPNKTPTATTGLEINNVRVDHPLIALTTETSHHFRASAKADWASNVIAMQIYSVNSSGKRTTSHAKIDVQVTPQQRWVSEWKRSTHLIKSRVDALDRSVRSDSGESHMIKRGMAYKLFGAIVQYGKEYQGMSEVILDSNRLEAVATVQLQVGQEGFTLNPKWIDSLGHIAGFIMNANDAVDSRTQAFINHGWERMRVAEPISESKTYRAYNRMQLVEGTSYAGDTYILEGGRIVAIFEGVRFQGVPRRMLDHLLPSKSNAPSTKTAVPSNQTTMPTPASATAPKPVAHLPLPSKPKSAAKALSGVLGRILAIISQEVGVEVSELKPTTDFADLGIDSLLSLTITSKIREEIGLDFPSSLFIDHPTVGELPVAASDDESDRLDDSSSSFDNSSDEEAQETKFTSNATSVYLDTPNDKESPTRRTHAILVIRQAIAEETQVAIEELKPTTSLVDIGIDSLLSLTIGAKMQELLEVDLPGTIFVEHEILQDVEGAICNVLGLRQPEVKKPTEPFTKRLVVSSSPAAITKTPRFSEPSDHQTSLNQPSPQPLHDSSLPQATSILLSGSPQTAQLVLFLFPDGSGSASSYAAVSRAIDTSKVAVYGLNCPWRTTGAEMTRLGITMSTMVSRYVVEVRRLLQQCEKTREAGRFPGPSPFIAFGGWSAGGIIAVEAVRQMQQQPEVIKISQLILFDSPNPIGLQNPPQKMYDFFDALGIFGSSGECKKAKTPGWLRQHFEAFLSILDAYEPTPLPHAPASLIVYARDGVCEDPNGPKMQTFPDDPREMLWLLNHRTDFSAEGWASILEPKKLSIKVLDNVHHFTLMDSQPRMKEMGQIVSDFLARGSRTY